MDLDDVLAEAGSVVLIDLDDVLAEAGVDPAGVDPAGVDEDPPYPALRSTTAP